MPGPFNLDAYLDRIAYAGPREPTLGVLRDLHRLHPAAIPYENLSPLMGDAVSLDLADLEAKLVRGGRGGYCYEHNFLFRAALEAMGFAVQGLGARVRWNMPEDAPLRARTHMVLRVDLPEGPYVADVGFGGAVMTGPLRLDIGPSQDTPHERFRLVPAHDGLIDVQAQLGPDWRTLFRFDETPHLPVDYEPMNWFSATHPTSPFTFGLMAARALPDRRLSMANTRFTVRRRGMPAQEEDIGSMARLGQVLTEDFGLTLPSGFERAAAKLGL